MNFPFMRLLPINFRVSRAVCSQDDGGEASIAAKLIDVMIEHQIQKHSDC